MNRLGASALMGAFLISTSVSAQPTTTEKPTSEKPAETEQAADEDKSDEDPAIEFHGQVNTGFKLFLDQPANKSRAKFEQYGKQPSGLFIDSAYLQAIAKGGFVADFWGTHVGQNNSNYVLQLAQPGHVYLNFEYDKTPHLNSTKALTLYDTSNPAALTIPDSIQAALQSGSDESHLATINANVHPLTLNIDRDTTKASLRYTPSPSWNIRMDVSREDRTGNLSFGTPINEFNAMELPAPVSYKTQNFSASAEYAGKLSDDKKFSLSAAFAGSQFDNKYSSFTWDNPFRLDAPSGSNSANQGRNALPPDNSSNRFSATAAVDLPFDSHYVGTVQRTSMRQNDAFIPFTINPALKASGGIPFTSLSLLPAPSLNGRIDETLINNVLTTRFSDDLTSTLRYRYLSLKNTTPRLLIREWVRWDGEKEDEARQNTRPAYDRTNTSFDLNWRMMKGWKLGTSVGLENYAHRESDVKSTDEYSVKVFADIAPEDLDWLKVRTSVMRSERTAGNYDAQANVGAIGHPPTGDDYPQSAAMRKFYLADRSRFRTDASAEMSFESGWTITPTLSWRLDEFADKQATSGLLGLKREGYWSAGLEQSIPITDEITLAASIMHEVYDRRMIDGKSDSGGSGSGGSLASISGSSGSGSSGSGSGSGSSGSGGSGGGGSGSGSGGGDDLWGSRINDIVDTFEGSATYALGDALLPGSTDLEIGYVFSRSNNSTDTVFLGNGNEASDPPFPDVKNDFQRFDATLKYSVDPDLVASLGWTGEATVKLRLSHESNKMTNWQIDRVVPYMVNVNSDADKSLFLAALDPNYSATAVTLELGFSW
ncbi:MAG: MtrB/PioB family decaheme-associated outer membrane protein [Micropepsaceae bacterium]